MGRLPGAFSRFQQQQPDLAAAYEQLGAAARRAGPLDERTAALVKLGIAIGARHEGAVHSHVRKALEAGAARDEIRHAAMLSITTIGFPNMMAALTWIDDVLARSDPAA